VVARRSSRRLAAVLAAAAVLVAPLAPTALAGTASAGAAPARAAASATAPVTVMTRNIYLGGDITRPLRGVAGKTGLEALLGLAHANADLRAMVDATDFPARSRLLAREVVQTRPDLVGLQEVALWRSGPLELPPPLGTGAVGVANARTVDLDFLQVLLRDLQAAGARYEVVHVQAQSDVEGPAFRGNPLDGSIREARDVRLTMRDAILRRVGSPVRIEQRGGGQFGARIPFSAAGLRYEFVRGYNWADASIEGRRFRFLNTHLESQRSLTAEQQAQELVTARGNVRDRPVVLVCDCNSDPLDGTRKPGDLPHWAAYRWLSGPRGWQGGFSDAWTASGTRDPGHTAGLSEDLRDATTAALDHRIDLVLVKDPRGSTVRVDAARLVGTDPAHRTPTGLWPSDHAGVVVQLRL
jgi:endonuclease/exonuclease/phosphatase family metal-dependent hydrolase